MLAVDDTMCGRGHDAQSVCVVNARTSTTYVRYMGGRGGGDSADYADLRVVNGVGMLGVVDIGQRVKNVGKLHDEVVLGGRRAAGVGGWRAS